MCIFNITKHQYYKFLINSLVVSKNIFTFAPAKMVDHPQKRVCDDWYIVNEYLFWGPTPRKNWPTKKGACQDCHYRQSKRVKRTSIHL